VAAHGIEPGRLTLGADNGTAYTSRGFRAKLKELGIVHRSGGYRDHRPGGYRDPESQAFIESWFSKLKERLIWRSEFETLDEAQKAIAYVETYHHRPHSGLGYRTPEGGETDLGGCPRTRSVYEITRPEVTTLEGPGQIARLGPRRFATLRDALTALNET